MQVRKTIRRLAWCLLQGTGLENEHAGKQACCLFLSHEDDLAQEENAIRLRAIKDSFQIFQMNFYAAVGLVFPWLHFCAWITGRINKGLSHRSMIDLGRRHSYYCAAFQC